MYNWTASSSVIIAVHAAADPDPPSPPAAAPPWGSSRTIREVDRISSLPDDVLGDIVSLLPTKDGARTQILSSRWRHIWRSAPLILVLQDRQDGAVRRGVRTSDISRILSTHPGPCRRFVMPWSYASCDYPARTTVDGGWLRSPALDNLQELRLQYYPRVLLPSSLRRFSSTLRVATFRGCTIPDGNYGGGAPLLLPVLESLTLSDVRISGSTLHALLAGCPVLQSLVLLDNYGFPRLQIVSASLRSIKVASYWRRLQCMLELVIQDAPCLERLQYSQKMKMNICVISAPRLAILGTLFDDNPRLQFGTTVLQATSVCVENAWYQTNPELTGALNIRVRNVVLENYQGSKSHIDFVKFFLSNARVLESLELDVRNIITDKWIATQQRLLGIKSASRGAHVTFVPHDNT